MNHTFKSILLLFFISIFCFTKVTAQIHLYSEDTLRMMFNKEIGEEDTSEEELEMMKIVSAWFLNEQEYIIQKIKIDVQKGTLNEMNFAGIAFLLDYELSNVQAKSILSITNEIERQLADDSLVIETINTFKYYYALQYSCPEELLKVLKNYITLMEGGKKYKYIDLGNLYSKMLIVLQSIDTNLYFDYLENHIGAQLNNPTLKKVYVTHHYSLGNYDIALQYSDTTDINPFEIMQLAQIYSKTQNVSKAMQYWDRLIEIYESNSFSNNDGFEFNIDENENSTFVLPIADILEAYHFYVSHNQLEKACVFQKIINLNLKKERYRSTIKNKHLMCPQRLVKEEALLEREWDEIQKTKTTFSQQTSICSN